MKKALSLVTALLLVFALAMFAACSGNDPADTGKIEGDYKEATAAELTTALASVEADKLFGDTEAEDWKFGVNANANFSVNGKMGAAEMNISTELSYLLNIANGENDLAMKGSAGAKFTAKIDKDFMGTPEAVDVTVDAKAYNDNEYVYVDATGKMAGEDDQNIKGKMSLEDVMGMVGDYLPMTADEDVDGGMEEGSSFDLASIAAMAEELGFKIALDTSDGVKIRLTADKEVFDTIVEMVMAQMGVLTEEGDEEEIASPIEFTKAVFELYIQIDKNGQFVAVASNFDIAVSVDPAMMTMQDAAADDSTKLTLGVSGVLSVQVSSKTVSLPSDLDSYTDLPFGSY